MTEPKNSKLSLHSWDDVRLLIAVAEHQGFAKAGQALMMDQETVAKRISRLEDMVGRPLFTRRNSGAKPTVACRFLLDGASEMIRASLHFEEKMRGVRTFVNMVTIAAPEGLLSYTLIPSLLNSSSTDQPLKAGSLRYPLPPLSFSQEAEADISLVPVSEGGLPSVKGNKRVRKIGTVHFAPFISAERLAAGMVVESFDELGKGPLIQLSGYSYIKSLDDWTGVCSVSKDVTVFSSTREMHRALFKGAGAGLFPTYSTMYETNSRMIEVPSPRLAASLWLVSEEESLRDPGVRQVYDGIADMFSSSPWFA